MLHFTVLQINAISYRRISAHYFLLQIVVTAFIVGKQKS